MGLRVHWLAGCYRERPFPEFMGGIGKHAIWKQMNVFHSTKKYYHYDNW